MSDSYICQLEQLAHKTGDLSCIQQLAEDAGSEKCTEGPVPRLHPNMTPLDMLNAQTAYNFKCKEIEQAYEHNPTERDIQIELFHAALRNETMSHEVAERRVKKSQRELERDRQRLKAQKIDFTKEDDARYFQYHVLQGLSEEDAVRKVKLRRRGYRDFSKFTRY
jgi:hypothetical protein